jgi:hypothetical protein
MGWSELVDAMVSAGAGRRADVESALEEVMGGDTLVALPDHRVADVTALLEGTVATHRLAAVELHCEVVALDVDLAALTRLEGIDGGAVLASGHLLTPVHDEAGSGWSGPPGWLRGCTAGHLVSFRVHRGRLEVGPAGAGPVPDGMDGRLTALWDHLNGGDGFPVPVDELVLAAIDHDPAPWAIPLPPLSELLPACGFVLRDGLAGRDQTDWAAYDDLRRRVRLLVAQNLTDSGLAAVEAALHAHATLAEGGSAAVSELAAMGRGLATEAGAAEAFWSEVEGDDHAVGVAAGLAGRLLGPAGGAARAVPLWLLARCAQRAGETLEAEQRTQGALEADPGFAPAAEDAAWYASDRGEARQAGALLGPLRPAGDGQVAFYHRMAAAVPVAAGRNDRCPCGSGRKYKHCHLGREQVALPDRVHWLVDKGKEFLHRTPGQREGFLALIAVLSGDHGGATEDLFHPTAGDLALFQDGGWGRFVAERGVLLPDDEREVARRWCGIRSSVYRAVRIRPGQGVIVCDLATGVTIDVRERAGSRQLHVDDLFWARVLPDGTGHQFSGALVRIPLRLRDALLAALDADPSGLELAGWLTAPSAPPRLGNSEGEDLVFCQARYALDNPDGARAVLDARLERDGCGEIWHEWVEHRGQRWIRVTFHLDDDGFLVVDANSVARFERACTLVASILPDARLLDEERNPAARLLARHRAEVAAGLRSAPAEDADDPSPEMAAALDEYLRDMEARWLDQPLPALGGLTPRQAAVDPDRSDDLRLLLHEFPEPGAGPNNGFDVGRLRELLDAR